jgi:TrmH family RNA methyltransferase
LLKAVRRAASQGTLTDDGLCVAEGFHLVEEALSSGCEIAAILVAESSEPRLPTRDLLVHVVSDAVFRDLSTTGTSQGVMALVRPPSWDLHHVMNRAGITLVLDGIQEPGNAGAIVRTAEAFGAVGIVFLKGTVSPFNPKCLRGSAGSLFRFPFVHNVDDVSFREELEGSDLAIFAAMPNAATAVHEANLRQGCAIVIGSEGHGVRPELRRDVTGLRIPTRGVESLNAAVAAAVVLYEAQRQRMAR